MFLDLIRYLLKYKVFIVANILISIIVAFIYALNFTKVQYSSYVTFIPTSNNQSSLSVGIGSLAGITSANSGISPNVIGEIFNSSELKRTVIDKFGLIDEYRLNKSQNKYSLAYKALAKDLTFSTVEQGSFALSEIMTMTISFFHTSPETAYEGAKYSYKMLDSAIMSLNSANFRNKREYLELSIGTHKVLLDSLNREMMSFQKSTKIYDFNSQAQIAISNYAALKSQIQSKEIQLQLFKASYSSENPIMVNLLREKGILLDKLSQIEKNDSTSSSLSLNKLSNSQAKYTELRRDIETANQVVTLLTPQLEEAYVNEKASMSILQIIDKPVLPVYKSRPKRALLIVTIVLSYTFTVFLSIILRYLFVKVFPNTKFVQELKRIDE